MRRPAPTSMMALAELIVNLLPPGVLNVVTGPGGKVGKSLATSPRIRKIASAGRVWVNNYHAYPAHSAFGGYQDSGIGRETHLMVRQHYQQTKNLLVSYSEDALGFFLTLSRHLAPPPARDRLSAPRSPQTAPPVRHKQRTSR